MMFKGSGDPLQPLADALSRQLYKPLPHPWRLVAHVEDGARWINPGLRASLIWSVEPHAGELWHHVSMAHFDRVPTWAELVAVKELIVGPESVAYQVVPPRSRWINDNEHVLHLWSPADGRDRLPDFGKAGHI